MKPVSLLVLLFAASLTGCAPAPAASLTATLLDPTDIRLDWPAPASGTLGQVVEYTNDAGGNFVPLAFLPPAATSYTHPRLIPDTAFYYRIRPFTGRLTAPVPATLDASAPAPADAEWAAPRTKPGQHRSLRTPDSAPDGLRVTPTGPDGVELTWTAHSDDEDAYLVEVTQPGGQMRIAGVLPRGTGAVGIYPLPEEHSATYRVAAITYGTPTPTVQRTTGGDPG